MRLRINVLESKLPFKWLFAGLSRPPSLTFSRMLAPSIPGPPMVKVDLSNPITVTGEEDLWIVQERVKVDIVDLEAVKALTRGICIQVCLHILIKIDC